MGRVRFHARWVTWLIAACVGVWVAVRHFGRRSKAEPADADRRVGEDRRSGFERRSADGVPPLDGERRSGVERRSGTDRRSADADRQSVEQPDDT